MVFFRNFGRYTYLKDSSYIKSSTTMVIALAIIIGIRNIKRIAVNSSYIRDGMMKGVALYFIIGFITHLNIGSYVIWCLTIVVLLMKVIKVAVINVHINLSWTIYLNGRRVIFQFFIFSLSFISFLIDDREKFTSLIRSITRNRLSEYS